MRSMGSGFATSTGVDDFSPSLPSDGAGMLYDDYVGVGANDVMNLISTYA